MTNLIRIGNQIINLDYVAFANFTTQPLEGTQELETATILQLDIVEDIRNKGQQKRNKTLTFRGVDAETIWNWLKENTVTVVDVLESEAGAVETL